MITTNTGTLNSLKSRKLYYATLGPLRGDCSRVKNYEERVSKSLQQKNENHYKFRDANLA